MRKGIRLVFRRTSWSIVVAGLASAQFLTAQAAEPGSLRFEDDRPITINWEDVDGGHEGAASEICNVGSATIESLQPRLTGFDFKQSGADVDVGSVLRVELEEPGELAPGDCQRLLISAALSSDSNPLDPGTYTGLLVVTGPGGLARREVSIAGVNAGESLRFAEDGTVDLIWADIADDGIEVALCNNSAADTAAPSSQLSGFGFKKLDGTAVAESTILAVASNPPGPIAPVVEGGDCPASLTIRAAAGYGYDNPLLPGEYSGLLVVTSGEISISREVTLSGAQSNVYNGVVGKSELRGQFSWWPFDHTVTLTSATFTLSYDEDLGEPEPPAEDDLLAQVAGGGDIGLVRLASTETDVNGRQTFTVRVSGINVQGEFTGPLEFDQFGGKTDVTLTVRDHWSRLLAALFLGVVLAFVVRWLEGRVLRRIDLRRERDQIDDAYERARTMFAAEPEWGNTYTPPTAQNVDLFLAKSKSATMSYAKRAFLLDTSSEAYKAIAKSLRAARDDAELLSSRNPKPVDKADTWKTGFAVQLQALKDGLRGFDDWLQEHALDRASPNLVYEAAGLLKPRSADQQQLTVGSALKRSSEIQSFINLMEKWPKLYQEVEVYAEWAIRLAWVIDDPRDQRRWDRAHVRILEVLDELFGVRNPDELEAVGAADDLKRIYALLARLGAQYEKRRPDWEDTRPSVFKALGSVFQQKGTWPTIRNEDDLTRMRASQTEAPKVSQFDTWLAQSVPSAVTGIGDVVIEGGTKFLIFASETLVILLSVVGGSAVAISALYTSTFGSFADYAGVFAAGFGLSFIVNGIVQGIQRRRDALGPAPAS